jgi:hypothetical protein
MPDLCLGVANMNVRQDPEGKLWKPFNDVPLWNLKASPLKQLCRTTGRL